MAIAFNVLPMAGALVDVGSEETDGHTLSINAVIEKDITPEQACELLGKAAVVKVVDVSLS